MYVVKRFRTDREWVYMNCYEKYSEAVEARDYFQRRYGGVYRISIACAIGGCNEETM